MTHDPALLKKIDAALAERPKGGDNMQITVPTNYREVIAALIASEVDATAKTLSSWIPAEPTPAAAVEKKVEKKVDKK